MDEQQQYKLKHDLSLVIIECFDRASIKKFKELNFSFPSVYNDKKSKRKFLGLKLSILNELDIYSKTFLSIHTRAKIALREFQEVKFDGAYLELLRLILTLNENIARKKSILIKEKEKHPMDLMELGLDITVDENIRFDSVVDKSEITGVSSKTKYIKEDVTGHQITKIKDIRKSMVKKCSDIEL